MTRDTTDAPRGAWERRARAGLAVSALAAAVVTMPTAGPAGAAPTGGPLPTVSISSLGEPTIQTHLACDGTQERTPTIVLLRVDRTGDTAGPLEVDVAYGGTLRPGIDYDAQADPVVIPAGDEMAFVMPEVTVAGTLTFELVPGDGYELGDPASRSFTIVEAAEDAVCPAEETQTIRVGQAPAPVRVFDRFDPRLPSTSLTVDGALPPGLTYVSDGTWQGSATTPGTYRFLAKYGFGETFYLELPLRIIVEPAVPGTPVVVPAAAPAGAVSGQAAYTG